MSRYHETVTWQSPDGTWCEGFMAELPAFDQGDNDEWDREFSTTEFELLLTADTEDGLGDALDRSGYPNPGGSTIAQDPADVARYEAIAAAFRASRPAAVIAARGSRRVSR